MDRVGAVFVFVIVVLAVGVFAETADIRTDIINFMKDKNISVEEGDIKEIDFSNLPGELDIDRIEGSDIGIYQVGYNNRSLFVVGHSGETKDAVVKSDVRYLLTFGSSKKMKKSGFLNMASGVEGSLEKGYVMMRSGSITGISTNLEVEVIKGEKKSPAVNLTGEMVDVVIYKNGEEVGFRNSLGVDSPGVVIDYDSQSKKIVSFDAGDVVSVYLKSTDGVVISDVTTMLEVTE